MSEQQFYWKAIKRNQFKGVYRDPRENKQVQATEKEMRESGFIKHFQRLGPVDPDYVPEPVEPEKMSISERTPEERLELIREKAGEFDKADKTQWYRGVPKLASMNSKLPFVTTYDEIRKALGVS